MTGSKIKSIAILFALCSISFWACSPEDDGTPEPDNSKSATLCKSPWIMTGFMAKIGVDDINVFPDLPACDKDNITKFSTNGTYTLDESTLKCSASDPQVTSGNWVFLENETKIQYSNDTYVIDILNETTLKVTGTIDDPDLGTIKATITFNKQ